MTSKKYFFLLILLLGLTQPIFAAFENLVLQDYLHSSFHNNPAQSYVYCGSLNFPSFKYLNQYELGFSFPLGKTNLGGHLYTSGDQLYQESMVRVYANRTLVQRLSYGIKVSGYQIRVEGYGSASTWSVGFSSQLALHDDIQLIVDYDNLLFLGSANINEDIPRRGMVTLESHTLENQTFIYKMEKEIPHVVNHHVYWKSLLRPSLSILGGFTSNPQTFIGGGQFEKGKMQVSVGMIYHPVLMTSVGLRLAYRL